MLYSVCKMVQFSAVSLCIFTIVTWAFSVVLSDNPMYDPATAPKHCQEAPPVQSNYTPKGTEWKLGDMTIYETADTAPKKVLIDVYDIFGFHPNAKQVADILAEASGGNFKIVMPDYFRGSPFTTENFPPKNLSEIFAFIQERGDWEKTVKQDTLNLIDHYRKNENVSSFGMFGFCWGGKITVQAASQLDDIKVAGLVHPSSVKTEEAYGVKSPMYLLPTKDEPDMLPFYNILQDRGLASGHNRFNNLPHGFAGARGNFSDPANIEGVREVITILGGFFENHLQ